jgi:hypothetical protein
MGVVTAGIQRFFHRPASFQSTSDQAAARELQHKLYGLFLGMHSMGVEDVKRAYLTDVQYHGLPEARLAICLVADRATAEKTALAIANVLEKSNQRGEFDVLFVSEQQEKQVRENCTPFFSA